MLLLARAKRQLHRVVAVAILPADRRHRAWACLQNGDSCHAAILLEDLGHSELLGKYRGHFKRVSLALEGLTEGSGGQADLDVHARRKVVEALDRVHRLRGRLMNVDQTLVRADLEVLA